MRFVTTAQLIILSILLAAFVGFHALQGVYDSIDLMTAQMSEQTSTTVDVDKYNAIKKQLHTIQGTRAERIIWLVAASIGVLSAALFIYWMLHQSIISPLLQLKQSAARIAQGDISHHVVLMTQYDVFDDIADSVNSIALNLKNTQSALSGVATRDQDTGLYNKREFRRRLNEEAERCRRYGSNFCLQLLRVDQFIDITGMYGVEAGKVLIKSISARIAGQIRTMDCLARTGDDEFALILPETQQDGADIVAERIRVDFAEHKVMIMQGHTVDVTMSLGVGSFPDDARHEADLIESVRNSLELAISSGGDRVGRATSSRGRV